MAMNEDFVSYELAVALKAAGFDEPCDHYWSKEFANSDKMVLRQASADDYNNDDWSVPHCSAPHIYAAQKWLREKWDLHIDVYPVADCSLDADGQVCEEWNYWTFDIMHVMSTRKIVEDEEQYGSYEEALSEGIKSALELIKKGV